jgi:DNA-binding NarL/FixJ family response regulator
VSQSEGRILIVDDFEQWRTAVRSMLNSHAHLQIVGEASGGLDAVEKAEELAANLILLDIGLPDLDGIEAGRRIHSKMPETMVIFLTANNDAELVRAAIDSGAAGYVLKADAGRELLHAVAAVLRGEKYLSRRVKDHSVADPDSE